MGRSHVVAEGDHLKWRSDLLQTQDTTVIKGVV
jgi:hypothetical protein